MSQNLIQRFWLKSQNLNLGDLEPKNPNLNQRPWLHEPEPDPAISASIDGFVSAISVSIMLANEPFMDETPEKTLSPMIQEAAMVLF